MRAARKKPAKRKPTEDKRSQQEKMKAFLQEYAVTCSVVIAADQSGVGRSTHYWWLKHAPKYAATFERTRQMLGDYIEDSAIDRAVEGWLEPIYYQGSQCGTVRRYDGGLMQLLLRGFKPEKYGHRAEISGPAGTPMQGKIEVVFVRPGDTASGDPGDSPGHF